MKDLKIVCDDGVVETYRPVFAWASSFIRSQSLGIDRAEFEKLDMSDKKAGKLKMLELPQNPPNPEQSTLYPMMLQRSSKIVSEILSRRKFINSK